MTTELEQEVYDTFGIERECHNPIVYLSEDKKCKGMCQDCEQYRYSVITAEKLLEMICILSQWDADNCYQILANNMRDLKNEILNDCINFKQKLKNEYFDAQIQQLFKD